MAAVWVSFAASQGRNVAVSQSAAEVVPSEVWGDLAWEEVSTSYESTARYVSKSPCRRI